MSLIKVAIQERSNPINIPIKIEIDLKKEEKVDINSTENFRVSANTFDPSKSSPPNIWNMRLNKRIEQYFQDSGPKNLLNE